MKLKKILVTSAVAAIAAISQSVFAAPNEINIAYVKSPFNLQNIVMKQNQLLENEFKKELRSIGFLSTLVLNRLKRWLRAR